MVVCGTRPEAIKIAPLVLALQQQDNIDVCLCVTGQHKEMLAAALKVFKLSPSIDLEVMQPNQDLYDVTSAVLLKMKKVLAEEKPDRIFVHGDTTTTLAGALAAFYAGIPVSHVEAGLRTGDLSRPWPEEANRKLVSVIADRHYAPTESSKENLLSEGVSANNILVTGNTVIDALQIMSDEFIRNSWMTIHH